VVGVIVTTAIMAKHAAKIRVFSFIIFSSGDL
jgi:hypothetical protein